MIHRYCEFKKNAYFGRGGGTKMSIPGFYPTAPPLTMKSRALFGLKQFSPANSIERLIADRKPNTKR